MALAHASANSVSTEGAHEGYGRQGSRADDWARYGSGAAYRSQKGTRNQYRMNLIRGTPPVNTKRAQTAPHLTRRRALVPSSNAQQTCSGMPRQLDSVAQKHQSAGGRRSAGGPCSVLVQ